MTKTSLDWWSRVLTEPGKLEDWLKRQYHSEASASLRIMKLKEQAQQQFDKGLLDISHFSEWKFLLDRIASDEDKHSNQVASLMRQRGLTPKILPAHKSKYFAKFQEGMDLTIYSLAAVAAFAEYTSLNRFKAILEHPKTPSDIRTQFTTIAFEEEFHYVAFKRLAGLEEFEKAKIAHQRGLQAVGIEE